MLRRQILPKFITLCLFTSFFVLAMLRAATDLAFTPDSSGYISASQNWIRTGHLFQFVNSPSGSLEPEIEPYTEQPSGFPIYLAPFLILINNPIQAAMAAQFFAIFLFYAGLYFLTQNLRLHPVYQVGCAALFFFFFPTHMDFLSFWSETLFIALTFWAIYFLGKSSSSRRPNLDWLAALALGAGAAATRANGVLLIGAFLLAAVRRDKDRPGWIAASVIFLAGPLAAWLARNQILYGSTSATHTIHQAIDWKKIPELFFYLVDSAAPSIGLAICVAAILLLSLAAPFFVPRWSHPPAPRFKTDFSSLRWYSPLLSVIAVAVVVVSIAADRLGFGGSPGLGLRQIFWIGLGGLLLAAAWARNTNLVELLRYWKASHQLPGWGDRRFFTFLLLLTGGLFHMAGITALSMITPFSPLAGRLISPSLALLLLAVVAGHSHLAELARPLRLAIIVYALGLFVVGVSPAFIKSEIYLRPAVRILPEQLLWQELGLYPGLSQSTHFYTDGNFMHQVFALRPQRILPDLGMIPHAGYLEGLMVKGTCPFVVVGAGSQASSLMNEHYSRAGLQRVEMVGGKFELFAQSCLFSP